RPLVPAECPDAVAGPQKGEVRADHHVEQFSQVCLDPPLHRGFRPLWVAGCERAAAQEDPRPVLQIDAAQRPLLQAVAAQVTLVQPGAGQNASYSLSVAASSARTASSRNGFTRSL